MMCPVCHVDLVIADRQGIEIDYCPNCRGVWLDRGELDKIIERSARFSGEAAPQYKGQKKKSRHLEEPDASKLKRRYKSSYRSHYDDDDEAEYDDDYDPHRKYQNKKHRRRKKKDFLDEIFDLFD